MSFKEQRIKVMDICCNLFKRKEVDLILGFTAAEDKTTAAPFFIRNEDDVKRLKWDDTCTPNLAKYLTERTGTEKTGIIAKPCDARAIVMYMTEKQIDRDNLFIIGMECGGMKTGDGNAAPGCGECEIRTPPIYDVLVEYGGPIEFFRPTEKAEDESEDRFAKFQKEIDKCILCFSCRQACYGCYCNTCFIDRGIPDWSPSDPDSERKMMFHLGRAMHLAGRCIGCGACERVCPSGVNIRYLIRELQDYSEELYGTKAGMNPGEAPAMTVFKQEDREEGFLDI